MNVLDIIIIIPLAIGLITGLFKGFIKELISLAAIILGILGAKFLEPYTTDILISLFNMQKGVAQPISYLILFVAIVALLLILAHLLDKLISAIALGGLNKILGGIFGAFKYALIVSVLLNVFDTLDQKFHFIQNETKESSFSYTAMINLAPQLWEETKDILFEENTHD